MLKIGSYFFRANQIKFFGPSRHKGDTGELAGDQIEKNQDKSRKRRKNSHD